MRILVHWLFDQRASINPKGIGRLRSRFPKIGRMRIVSSRQFRSSGESAEGGKDKAVRLERTGFLQTSMSTCPRIAVPVRIKSFVQVDSPPQRFDIRSERCA